MQIKIKIKKKKREREEGVRVRNIEKMGCEEKRRKPWSAFETNRRSKNAPSPIGTKGLFAPLKRASFFFIKPSFKTEKITKSERFRMK